MKHPHGDYMPEVEVEDFWDPILSDDTIIEIDCDWVNQIMQRAKEIESDILINILVDEQLQA